MNDITIKTRDVAYQYRMQAGSPGEIVRAHPMNIYAHVNNPSGGSPLTLYGQAALFDTAVTVNTLAAYNATTASAESLTGNNTYAIAGVTVRPFPTQDSGSSESFGAAAFGGGGPAAGGIVDILVKGSIAVTQSHPQGAAGAAASVLGGVVYVRIAAGSGSWATAYCPVGGFESIVDQTVGNQIIVANAYWNGPNDGAGLNNSGVAELVIV